MGPRARSSLLICAIVYLMCGDAQQASDDSVWRGFSVRCGNDDNISSGDKSDSCHGVRLVRRIVQRMLDDLRRRRSLEIVEGVSLVRSDAAAAAAAEEDGPERDGRWLRSFGNASWIVKFLRSRELRIKLPSLLPANLEQAVEQSLPNSADEGTMLRLCVYSPVVVRCF